MNKVFRMIFLFSLFMAVNSCSSPAGNENTTVSVVTTLGEIRIKLYDVTPIHRDNFIKLVKSGFYEGISFHRVIKDFMIQAGDPMTRTGNKSVLPDSLNTYTIPAEFNSAYFHKKGALAAAREGNDVNPEMRSSGTQFYIVEGIKLSDEELDQSEQRIDNNMKQAMFNRLLKQTADSVRSSGGTVSDAKIQELASMKMFVYLTTIKPYKISDEQRNIYKTAGGTPRLDGTYTVFGEVVSGIDVVDKIAAVQTDKSDKPLIDVRIIKMKIVKN